MPSLDHTPFHRSSTPMPLSARAVPRRFSPRRGLPVSWEPVTPVPSTTSWTDRIKRTVWDRTTGWLRRRLDDWVHHNLDQLLPEPPAGSLLPVLPDARPDRPSLTHDTLLRIPVDLPLADEYRDTGLAAPPPAKRRRRNARGVVVDSPTPPCVATALYPTDLYRSPPPVGDPVRSHTRNAPSEPGAVAVDVTRSTI